MSGGVRTLVDAAERGGVELHSFLLMRRGAVVAEAYWEPYRADQPHMLFSLSKSFSSTAIGMMVAEGRLSIEDPVLGFFPDDGPSEPSAHLRAMRVRHLLTMTTGHDVDPTRSARLEGGTWAAAFFAAPVTHEPGTHFVYNSIATYMLSAIVQRLAGERMLEYLRPRLFGPLGIEGPTWEQSPQGIDTGGWGLSIRTADIARFGQLYLQRGTWQGRQLLPAAWVDAATAGQVPSGPSSNPDWVQGYGYQFWRARHGAYRGDGAFGQFCVVMPEQEAVVAVTAGVANMQSVLDLVWEHVLPALTSDTVADERLTGLTLKPAAGRRTSHVVGREFAIDANDDGIAALGFHFGADLDTLTIRGAYGEQAIRLGHGCWERGEATLLRPREAGVESAPPSKLAASGAWADDHTYIADLVWYETPFRRRLTCRFDGDRVTVEQAVNVSFGPTERPTLTGRAAPAVVGAAGTV